MAVEFVSTSKAPDDQPLVIRLIAKISPTPHAPLWSKGLHAPDAGSEEHPLNKAISQTTRI